MLSTKASHLCGKQSPISRTHAILRATASDALSQILSKHAV